MGKLTLGKLPQARPEYSAQMLNDLVRILELTLNQIDTDAYRLGMNVTPSTASDSGVKGDIRYDSDYIYICVDTDTWKRTALSTW